MSCQHGGGHGGEGEGVRKVESGRKWGSYMNVD